MGFYLSRTRNLRNRWDLNKAKWYVRPKLDGRINTKLDGQKTDLRAEPKAKNTKNQKTKSTVFYLIFGPI